ncbi:MAG: hypothetical protein HQL30_10315, partial [Candidatus Omnitrophica bacterium]|nr:hypothetical protein [Candidatus Omnitrophota bacterium]
MNIRTIKITTIMTLIAFLFNIAVYDIAFGGEGVNVVSAASDPMAVTDALKALAADTFVIPEYLGKINDSFKAQKPGKIVLHIQDAHCNYAAQRRVAEIIDHISREYGVNVINMEGGTGKYDLSPFTGIGDKTIREKVSDLFVKEGLVNGGEYFAANNPEKAELWGIEDAKLYLDNLAVYRGSLEYVSEAKNRIDSLEAALNSLKSRIYSKELAELDGECVRYRSGDAEFRDHVSYLIRLSGPKGIDIKGYPNLFLLARTIEAEKGIDFHKANTGRDILIGSLEKKLSKKKLDEIAKKTIEFRAERISEKDYYPFLADMAAFAGIKLDEYPELQKFVVYISLYGATDRSKIMDEMDGLETRLIDVLSVNPDEKKLAALSKDLSILRNIFDFKLTRNDYKYYLGHKSELDAAYFISFIEKASPVYGIKPALSADMGLLDGWRSEITKFYEYSFKRDEAFLKNLRFQVTDPPSLKLRRAGNRPAFAKATAGRQPTRLRQGYGGQATDNKNRASILVTGGFHTENLAEMMRAADISYVSIMPAFKSPEGYESPYFNILAGKKSGLIASLDAALSSMQVPGLFTSLGISIDSRSAELVRVGAAALAYAVKLGEQENGTKGIAVRIKGDGKNGYLITQKTGERYVFSFAGTINAAEYELANKETEPVDPADLDAVQRALGRVEKIQVVQPGDSIKLTTRQGAVYFGELLRYYGNEDIEIQGEPDMDTPSGLRRFAESDIASMEQTPEAIWLNKRSVFNGYMLYGHGTNGDVLLRAVIKSTKQLVPSENFGDVSLTGESGGTSKLNESYVSTFDLNHRGSSTYQMKSYATKSVDRFRLTRKNIDLKIGKAR